MPGKDPLDSMKDFNTGYFDLPGNRSPGADANPDIQAGRRIRNSGRGGGQAPGEKQSFADAVGVLVAMAGAIAGLFIGGSIGGWILAIVLGVVGFVAPILAVIWLEDLFKGMVEKRLWRNRPHDRTSDQLREYWRHKFDAELDDRLLDDIAENGAAWVMDKRGNFILRTRTGDRLFVGHANKGDAGITVEKRGSRKFTAEDALLVMLARRSAGATTAGLTSGNKKAKALMWAAAKLAGLEVVDYEPDARAIEALDELRRQFPDTGSE
ncbi:MAG: hypothetical protein QNJ73_15760 [Gammaproteobacteria bacterium]|nr:hypothetical protein [Gammaproteobacteria bacterium]